MSHGDHHHGDVTAVSAEHQAVLTLNPTAYTHASVKPTYQTNESKEHYKRNADIPTVRPTRSNKRGAEKKKKKN